MAPQGEVQLAGGSLRAWLLAVAGNEARTEWRRAHRVGGQRVAVCYDDPSGPVSTAGFLGPEAETHIITSLRRNSLVVALLTVAPDVERVEIATVPFPGSVGSGAACTVRDGLALCMLRADGSADVRTINGAGTGVVLPIP